MDAQLKSLFYLSPVPVSLSTLTDGRLVAVNNAGLKFFEVTRKEVIGKTTIALNWWVDLKQRDQALHMIRKQGNCHNIEAKFRAKSGQIRSALWSAYTVVFDNVSYLMAIALDITEHKNTEEEILRTRDLLNETGRIAKVGGWEFDIATMKQKWTDEVYRIHEVDLDYQPTVEKGIAFYAPEAVPLISSAVQQTITKGKPFDMELAFITAKGNRRWVHAAGKAYRENGKIVKVGGVFQDITERKLAEEQLRATLRDKEVLLKEIHHRVKNNMQVISSLLSLQSAHLYDRRDQGMFQDTQDRVRAMALIHERLYQTEQFSRINFAGYLRDLIQNLFRTYRVGTDAISLDMELEDIEIGIDLAIPGALIVNELVTNCLKYAFPNGRKGVITISLKRAGDGVRLRVLDNGIGLPPDLDLKNPPSFGLTIISILVNQLGGVLEFDRTNGTVCTITFKIPEPLS